MSSTLLRVAVLMGGSTESHEEALEAGRQVIAVLKSSNVDATAFEMRRCTYILVEQLRHFDVVFIALHTSDLECGSIQGLLHSLKIPFVGSGFIGAALAASEEKSKEIWCARGLPFGKDATGIDYEVAILNDQALGLLQLGETKQQLLLLK